MRVLSLSRFFFLQSCVNDCVSPYPDCATALAAYSTWKSLPSGEYVEHESSYCKWEEVVVLSVRAVIYNNR